MPSQRELFLHGDPAAVGVWCRSHAEPGSVFVAPSAAARRLALRSVVDTRGTTLGLTVTSSGRFLSLLESRAGLATPKLLSHALERFIIADAARAARVPLFDEADRDAPAGAVNAVANLIRTLRLNRVTPEQFEAAGGDSRAGDAYRRFETARAKLGAADETDRIDAVLRAGVPSLALVVQDPSFPHRAARDLFQAVIAASHSSRIGASSLADDDARPSWTRDLEPCGFTVTAQACTLAEPATRAIGGIGMHDEIELVAREMLSLLRSRATVRDASSGRERPLRADDLLGVAPNANYLRLLNDACGRLGIPVASPRGCDTTDVPLVRVLLDTFRLLVDPDEDTPERGLALLGTPYVGLSLDRQDRLARTLLLRGLGSLRSWHRFAAATRSRKFVKLASNVAQLADRLTGERAPRDLSAALTSLGLDFGFLSSGRRFNLSSGRDEALRLDQQGWEALTAAAEELNDALRTMGVTRISARRWLAHLVETLSASSVRVDAKALDGVHLTIAGAGLPSAPHVFAVGWREGLFPRRTREDPLLPERVKKALNEQGAMLPLVADRTTMEYERRERIRRAARATLTISWPSTGEDGERLLPSFYMDDLGVTDRTVRSVGDATWPLPIAASRGERFARATLVARHRPTETVGTELDAVRDALSVMDGHEQRAYDGLMHAGQVIQLPPEILAEVGPMAAKMSASQARMVVHCLYEHFAKRRLVLDALVMPLPDQRDIGSIAHSVLNDIGRAGFDTAMLDTLLTRWWTETIPAELHDDAVVRFEREMLLANLTALLEGERELFATAGCRPVFFELAFGTNDEGRDPASLADGLDVPLPAGSAIASSMLRGSIDRVDVVERDGRRYGVAIDYKSGKGDRYGKEMEEMADFQLPIYCEVLPRFGVEPVGAVYLGIASGERFGVMRADFAESFLPAECKGVKLMEPGAFTEFMRERQLALRTEIARLARGELMARPRNDDCGYCDLRPVCRIGTFGVGATHAED